MHVSAIRYSFSFQEFLLKSFTFPKVGNLLMTFFSDWIIAAYTKIWVDLSGFHVLVDGLTEQEAAKFLKTHTKMLGITRCLKQTFPDHHNVRVMEFKKIVSHIESTLLSTIDQLEEKLNPHYSYQITTFSTDNDWNNPENDHWDNY